MFPKETKAKITLAPNSRQLETGIQPHQELPIKKRAFELKPAAASACLEHSPGQDGDLTLFCPQACF